MQCKFDVHYVMEKESLPFTKYPALLQLEARHGINVGFKYSTPDSVKLLISYITMYSCMLLYLRVSIFSLANKSIHVSGQFVSMSD